MVQHRATYNDQPIEIYRTAPFSVILNDPYARFQSHAILWCWICQKRYEIQTQFQWNT